jgi:site-specific DNA-methyltransferase (adenine-specific)
MLLQENLLPKGTDFSPKKEIERLYILPSFERTLNNSSFKTPMEIAKEDVDVDAPTDYNSVDGIGHQERINHYCQLADIDYAKDPFHVWLHKGVKYIIDGRFDEYRYAVDNNSEIYTIVHRFDSISQARAFMMLYLLEKPQYNGAQRCLMALQLETYFSKKAAKNKGRRTDLMDDSTSKFKKIRTTKELAKIASVGEQYFKQFRRVLKDGEKYFGKEQCNEYISQILREATSVNAIHRKLIEAVKVAKERESFANENENDLLTSNGTVDAEVKEGHDEDELEDAPIEIVYENPDYETDFHNKIVCESNIEAFKKIPDNSVNLIFGSSPYNVPRVGYDINIPIIRHEAHVRQIAELGRECYRITRHGGRLILNVAPTRGNEGERDEIFETFIVHDIISAFENLNIGWKKRNVIVWNKRCSFQNPPKGQASAVNPYFRANHEYLIVFSKGDWKATPEMVNAPSDLTNAEYHKWGQSLWNIVPQSTARGDHPCPFPEPLAERVIKMFSFVGDTVVEPWLGSGTTTAVAARLGRRWFGCDISPKYCLQSAQRTAKAHQEFIDEVKANEEISKNAA